MDTTDASRINGTQLQGANPGTNGGATGQELQGSSLEPNANTVDGINNLQPQGTFTVQDLSNSILPKGETGNQLLGPIVIIAALAIAVVAVAIIYKKYAAKLSVEALDVVLPVQVAAEPIVTKNPIKQAAVKKVVKKARAKAKPANSRKKPTPKKRAATGRKKR